MTGLSLFRRLTSEGVAGLHVFGLSGSAIEDLERDHLRGRPGPGQGLRFARLVDHDLVIDEVVIRRKGQDLEISIHGGLAVEARVRELLIKLGFEEDVSSDGSTSTSGSALRLLREARTRRQVLYFARLGDGALDRRLRDIAVSLDEAQSWADLRHQKEELETLLSRAPYGLAMTEPPVVVLRGPVNAGKSSLFNELVGNDRVIVSDLPGTTRDAVEALVDIEGFPFRLVDLAGERATEDPVEILGQKEGQRRAALADLVLDLLPVQEQETQPSGSGDRRLIPVASRADECTEGSESWLRIKKAGLLLVSARERRGLERLKRLVVARSAFGGPANEDMPGPFQLDQLRQIEAALQVLDADPKMAAQVLFQLCG